MNIFYSFFTTFQVGNTKLYVHTVDAHKRVWKTKLVPLMCFKLKWLFVLFDWTFSSSGFVNLLHKKPWFQTEFSQIFLFLFLIFSFYNILVALISVFIFFLNMFNKFKIFLPFYSIFWYFDVVCDLVCHVIINSLLMDICWKGQFCI